MKSLSFGFYIEKKRRKCCFVEWCCMWIWRLTLLLMFTKCVKLKFVRYIWTCETMAHVHVCGWKRLPGRFLCSLTFSLYFRKLIRTDIRSQCIAHKKYTQESTLNRRIVCGNALYVLFISYQIRNGIGTTYNTQSSIGLKLVAAVQNRSANQLLHVVLRIGLMIMPCVDL